MTTEMQKLLCDIVNSPEGVMIPENWRIQYSGQRLYFSETESLRARCNTILYSSQFIEFYGLNYSINGFNYSLDDTGFKKY